MRSDLKIAAVGALTAGAFIVFTLTLARASLIVPEAEIPPEDVLAPEAISVEEVSEEAYPARLSVPALGIDAKVQEVGINAAGNMAVPTNYQDVGWYRHGTVPGFRGSAVMDGHLDNGLGMAAVFRQLSTLRPGDSVFVETREGTQLEFKVESVESYAVADVPLERVFNQSDRPRLNLITCAGAWNSATRDYERRVVVYAVLV